MTTMQDIYPDGLCPDCFMEIPKGTEDGDECLNCGHVFYMSNKLEQDNDNK